jgi:hypothetical protein
VRQAAPSHCAALRGCPPTGRASQQRSSLRNEELHECAADMVKRRRRGTLRQRRAYLRSSDFRGQGSGPVARDFLQRHFQALPAGEFRGNFRPQMSQLRMAPEIISELSLGRAGKCRNYFPGCNRPALDSWHSAAKWLPVSRSHGTNLSRRAFTIVWSQ